mmetsp:Transcript_19177/g.13775  ORF Transcript_19177/g.13775 Transcript_19177/m.13775 type:complete len:118 (+) Transcript_19177:53-406(+)
MSFVVDVLLNVSIFCLLGLFGLVFGLFSNALHKKYNMPNSYILLTVVYFALHLIFESYEVSLVIQFMLGVFLCACVWLGSRMCVIGLTGGIACGKSTVADILTQANCHIIDSDKISR